MVKVKVPQREGDIRIARGGDEPVVYEVSGGHVSVDEADVAHFLTVVAGAAAVDAKAAAAKE
jgi:hypothetical protein